MFSQLLDRPDVFVNVLKNQPKEDFDYHYLQALEESSRKLGRIVINYNLWRWLFQRDFPIQFAAVVDEAGQMKDYAKVILDKWSSQPGRTWTYWKRYYEWMITVVKPFTYGILHNDVDVYIKRDPEPIWNNWTLEEGFKGSTYVYWMPENVIDVTLEFPPTEPNSCIGYLFEIDPLNAREEDELVDEFLAQKTAGALYESDGTIFRREIVLTDDVKQGYLFDIYHQNRTVWRNDEHTNDYYMLSNDHFYVIQIEEIDPVSRDVGINMVLLNHIIQRPMLVSCSICPNLATGKDPKTSLPYCGPDCQSTDY